MPVRRSTSRRSTRMLRSSRPQRLSRSCASRRRTRNTDSGVHMSLLARALIRIPRVGLSAIAGCALLTLGVAAQEHVHPTDPSVVELQPLAQQVRRLETALAYLRQPLPAQDREAIDAAIARADTAASVAEIQRILDRSVLATVHINPESRVKVEQGQAKPELLQGGTRLFL